MVMKNYGKLDCGLAAKYATKSSILSVKDIISRALFRKFSTN